MSHGRPDWERRFGTAKGRAQAARADGRFLDAEGAIDTLLYELDPRTLPDYEVRRRAWEERLRTRQAAGPILSDRDDAIAKKVSAVDQFRPLFQQAERAWTETPISVQAILLEGCLGLAPAGPAEAKVLWYLGKTYTLAGDLKAARRRYGEAVSKYPGPDVKVGWAGVTTEMVYSGMDVSTVELKVARDLCDQVLANGQDSAAERAQNGVERILKRRDA